MFKIRKDDNLRPFYVKDFNSGETIRYTTFSHISPRQIQANLCLY
jgi:hypothetical protein